MIPQREQASDGSKRSRLLERLAACDGGVVVAFSGGVDSAVVAKAAQLVHGDRALAVTAVSASLKESERQRAREVAQEIGIRHQEVETREIERSAYRANGVDRCFHCKTELYDRLEFIGQATGARWLLNGANQDDLGDHRPGLRAARDFEVVSPLVDCEFSKQDVRELAREWHLSVSEKPASPCLASRIAYGQAVTVERLAAIEQAEAWLAQRGLNDVRVRWHADELARVEVQPEEIAALCQEPLRSQMAQAFRSFGFKFVTLDLEGRRSGSLNQIVPISELERSLEPSKPAGQPGLRHFESRQT